MGQQSEVKEEDALFMPCFFAVRSMHHYKTTVTQSLQRRAEVESMKGDFAETTRFLTDDKELSSELTESYDSLSRTLEERHKGVAKRGTPRQTRHTYSRQHTLVAGFVDESWRGFEKLSQSSG